MQRLKSLVFGSIFGLLALFGLMAFGVQDLTAGNGFCDRMDDGSIVCCSTDDDGKILDCKIIVT